eukprot:scaffold17045_cov36-Phaeocystis_antarctica.AAC.1
MEPLSTPAPGLWEQAIGAGVVEPEGAAPRKPSRRWPCCPVHQCELYEATVHKRTSPNYGRTFRAPAPHPAFQSRRPAPIAPTHALCFGCFQSGATTPHVATISATRSSGQRQQRPRSLARSSTRRRMTWPLRRSTSGFSQGRMREGALPVL